ncbi:Translocase of chloroplast [Cardamine amara subsp. amara]|uniref:Translocase of chloroplast n=1 Tax=Cardamine amara subsp. amara TaxID=228776 RepID=A0ABD1C6S6_CARAN
MVAPDETSFSAMKQSGQTWASVVTGGGGDNEVGAVSSDTSSQYLAGKSECCNVDDSGLSDSEQSISPMTCVSPVEERIVVKEIDKDEVVKFEIVSVDVEKNEVVDENLILVSEDETKEEKILFSDKVDDDDKIDDQVVEEEAVKLRNFIVDLLAKESQETDDLTAADDGEEDSKSAAELQSNEIMEVSQVNNVDEGGNKIPVADIVSTRDFSTQGSSAEGVDGSGSGEETKEMIVGSSKSGEQSEKVSSSIDANSDETNIPSNHVDRIDGQIVTDSEEEVDMDDEGNEKTFDTEALAAFLKASTGGSSDGGNFTITSQDVMKLFSMEPPAGLGSSSGLFQSAASLPNRSNTFPNLTVAMGGESESNLSEEEKQKLEKLQTVRVKYLRLVHRLGQSVENSLAVQNLYNLALLAGRHSGYSFSLDAAKKMAMDSEAEGEDLDFSLNILVLGKSGVGKSATINSILGDQKASIHAFGPSTTFVREISGIVDGVKITIIDTPGLKSAAMDQSANSKMLSSVKKLMKKYPPDVVLYVDRLDAQNRSLNNMPLLRTITASLGSSILKNAIVTLTHAASIPPDGPYGTTMNYDVFVEQCTRIVQHSIGQAVGDLRLINSRLMNPVSLVENHPLCRKNRLGVKVLPNGQTWRPQLLLLCYSLKILSQAKSLMKSQKPLDHRKVFDFRVRSITLPNLLSWLLQSRAHPKLPAEEGGDNVDSDIEIDDVSDSEQEDGEDDEYDQLPPFKPLRKNQLAKLSKEHRKAYFEEYDYRVKLLQKKQWRDEVRRMKEIKKNRKNKVAESEYGYLEEEEAPRASPPALLPDLVLPPSFDSDHSAYRYRSLEPTSQLVTRSLLDTQGWDHDCGLDCVIAEKSLAIAKRFPAEVSVQVTKDKKEFNIALDSSVCAKHGDNGSTMAGLVIKGSEQLMYMIKGETKFKNFRKNKTTLAGLVIFFGGDIATGLKLEDQIALGKRLVLVGNAGTTRSQGDSAYEANLEVRLREADFPIGQNQYVLGLSLTNSKNRLTLATNLRSEVSIGRHTKIAALASLDNKRTGRFIFRTSSSDQLQIGLMAILPLAMSIYKMIIRSEEN